MKKLLLLLLLPVCVCCGKNNGYRIEGTVPGAPEGLTVWLLNQDVYPFVATDSAEIRQGRFLISNDGPLDYPFNASLVIGREPREERPEIEAKAYRFFMDRGDMVFHCIYDSLPSFYYESRSKVHNVSFSGSASQDISAGYDRLIKEYADERAALWEEYLEVYHRPALEGVFNTAEGKEIVRKRIEAGEKIRRIALDFVETHNASQVSVDLVLNMLLRPTKAQFTAGSIDSLLNSFDPSVRGSRLYGRLEEAAAKAKDLAYGEKYKDIDLTDREGNRVKLSDFVQPGKYNMLEFWASWCGPCRGEIPHLRHLYEQVGAEKLNMISISIDENMEDWRRAIDEEKMVWAQLCDTGGFGGPVSAVYHVNGIPDCLIIDPEGRIVGGNYRGSSLDLTIEKLTGVIIR